MDRTRPWTDYPLVAFDTETSGAYPVGSEIVEFGAVKWFQGQVVDRLQILIKPEIPMGEEVIKIHGITNEMVAEAPPMKDVIAKIHAFLDQSLGVAHHAPFDMGFIAYDIERFGLAMPTGPVFCSSLLSRKFIHGVENHKLQTLVKHLGLEGGSAHRAADDAYACLQVALKTLESLGPNASIQSVLQAQEKKLEWPYYSLKFPTQLALQSVVRALQDRRDLNILYQKGSKSKQLRPVRPLGIVRNPDGDYLAAICLLDHQKKRFYLQHLSEAETAG
ncbi:MAG: PolC-type DNA polymerase III [Bdellovibrionales bacterium]